jgi:hypothetical protein
MRRTQNCAHRNVFEAKRFVKHARRNLNVIGAVARTAQQRALRTTVDNVAPNVCIEERPFLGVR